MKASKRTLEQKKNLPTDSAAPQKQPFRLSERQRRIILTNGPILLLLIAVPLFMNTTRLNSPEDARAATELTAAAEAHAEKMLPADLLAAAESGDPAALLVLGTRTYQGSHGIPQNREKGIALCKRAGEAGNPNGWFFAGFFLSETEKELPQAVPCFRKAADANHTVALGCLGSLYEHGHAGLEKNTHTALKLYRRAADLGDPEGSVAVARLLLEGENIEHSTPEAIRYLREAAAKNSARAHLMLSTLYASGNGVPTDLLQAAKYALRAEKLGDRRAHDVLMNQAVALLKSNNTDLLIRAADAGVPLIAAKLGIGYATGRGLPLDYALAHARLEQGAAENIPEAQIELGRLLLLGLGKPANTERAAELLCAATNPAVKVLSSNASEDKDSDSKLHRDAQSFMTRLTDILIEQSEQSPAPDSPLPLLCERIAAHAPDNAHRLGSALLKNGSNPQQGLQLLTAAEKAGNADAAFRLAEYYLNADNPILAARHALIASEDDHPAALHLLATLYLDGRGVPKNKAAARRYDRRAAKLGHEPSAQRLKAQALPPPRSL